MARKDGRSDRGQGNYGFERRSRNKEIDEEIHTTPNENLQSSKSSTQIPSPNDENLILDFFY